eukprot:09334.XXX_201963_202277_1 [CDS] Oithona nana genome sequencing.
MLSTTWRGKENSLTLMLCLFLFHTSCSLSADTENLCSGLVSVEKANLANALVVALSRSSSGLKEKAKARFKSRSTNWQVHKPPSTFVVFAMKNSSPLSLSLNNL